MRGQAELDRIIVRIYELGLDVDLWPQMLDEIAAFYGCSKIGYMHISHDDTRRVMGFFRHPEPDAPKVLNGLATYEEMPPGSDIWFELLNQPGMAWDGPYHCNKHVPVDAVVKSDHYNLVVKEVGCFDNLGMRIAMNCDYGCYLSVYSDGPERMFTEEDVALHRALYTHIRRVVDTQTKFSHALRTASLQAAALDFIDSPVFIVNAAGRIISANAAAQSLLLAGDGVEERQGRLALTAGDDEDRLGAVLRRACGVGDRAKPVGASLAFFRTPPKPALGAQILPFDPAVSDDPFQRFAFERLALVMIADPDAKRPVNDALLTAMYGLRPSEARVAELLVAGVSQKEIAETLKLSEGTARWHVKNLMSKVGVRRESQLVARLRASLPPAAAPVG